MPKGKQDHIQYFLVWSFIIVKLEDFMQEYLKSVDDILSEQNIDITKGLSDDEVRERLEKFGENKLKEGKKKSMIKMFLEQLNDWLIYILLGATVLTIIVGEYADAIIILAVVLINAIIGVVQEEKASKAVEALKKLSTPKVLVRRNGVLEEIDSHLIVPGDIIILDSGRYVPADLRLISSSNLQIEESSLTGESVPSDKFADYQFVSDKVPLGDQKNMAFSSTLVTYGRGEGIVVKTAMETEIGKIATILTEGENEQTPLQRRLGELGKVLGIIALLVCLIMFGVMIIQETPWEGGMTLETFNELLITSISLAVAAIPEGLAAIVAIVLAIGTTKMSKRNAIVKKLPAVETLGSVNIICSDKTGTLTQNKMSVLEYYTYENKVLVNEKKPLNDDQKLMATSFILSSDATSENGTSTGDPTEIALIELGNEFGLHKNDLNNQHIRVDELPFDSERKLMSTLNQHDGFYRINTKGALDNIFKISTKVLINGKEEVLTNEIKETFIKASDEMSSRALRVLGVAYRDTKNKIKGKDMEHDLVLVGFVGMIDPPREEVKDSIKVANKAGIKVVMITGDHKNTAFAIAKELNIAKDMSEVMTGAQLDELTPEKLAAQIDHLSVFARVSPENKVTIVNALRAKGNIVSMTGDGVNDAPSLKSADIGVAMGITGTDVAKGAADMILTDDNFTTIVHAIEEGRNIYNNIKKAVIFLLSCNLGEIIAIFLAVLLGWPAPLIATQILWINLVTDTLPAISLGMDPGDPDVMKNKPRPAKESFFAHGAGIRAIVGGVLVGLMTLTAFVVGLLEHNGSSLTLTNLNTVVKGSEAYIYASTMAFVVLAMSQLFYAFTMRNSHKSIIQVGLFKNKWLIGSLIVGTLLQIGVIAIPFLQDAFGVQWLSWYDWVYVIAFALVPVLANEIIKVFMRLKSNKN